MENATKALLIAGGVFIGIIILSIGVHLYILFSGQADEYNQSVSNVEIQKFNSTFEVYIGRTDIKAQDIISICNLAQKYDNIITIDVKNKSNVKITISNSEAFLTTYIDSTFKCEKNNVTYNELTGKINKIVFKENNS